LVRTQKFPRVGFPRGVFGEKSGKGEILTQTLFKGNPQGLGV